MNGYKVALVITALLVAYSLKLGPISHAITITMEYSDEGSPIPHPENPSWDPAGIILKLHFQAAKEIWELLLPGPGNYEFDFQWDDDIAGLGLTTENALDTFIEINPNYSWFADPTPNDNVEFNTANAQSLYSQLSAFNQTTYFPGTPPPGGLEVGYRATGLSIPSASGVPGVNASNGFDLLSTVVHEIGHVLGISGVEPGEYNIFPQHVGGLQNVLVAEDDDSPHLGGDGVVPFLMCENCGATGVRRFPTATDILVIAEDQGITDVFLPRVGRISSGLWNEPNAWIGGDAPGFPQDVYITHGGTVTLGASASAKDLLIAGGNSLVVGNHTLTATSTLTFGPTTVSIGTGGNLAASSMVRTSTDLITAAGSTVYFNSYSGGASTTANFNGKVNIGFGVFTDPSVTFDPSTITNWSIAEELAVDGGQRFVTLVIDNLANFTSGSGRIGGYSPAGSAATVNISGNGSRWDVNGPLDVPRGNLNIVSQGTVESNSGTVGSNSGRSFVTVDNALWDISSDLEVGPATLVGDGQGTLTMLNFGSTRVPGNVNVHGTSTRISEINIQSTGVLDVGGEVHVGPNGMVIYRGSSEARGELHGAMTFENLGGAVDSGAGGVTRFLDTATAKASHFTNHPGATTSANGGVTEFRNFSSAADARLDNLRSLVSFSAGSTRFYDFATASDGEFYNHPGFVNIHATIEFNGDSTGGNGTFVNLPGVFSQSVGGAIIFNDRSKAGFGTYTSQGEGGTVTFNGSSNAENGTFTTADNIGGNSRIQFFGNSTAGIATFSMGANTPLQFYGNSTAAGANITLRRGGLVTFSGDFNPGLAPTTTAGNSQITVEGSSVPSAFSGSASFSTYSTAGDATITAQGGSTTNAGGGTISFDFSAHAGNSKLIANEGTNGGAGGQIFFRRGATGDNSRVTIKPGAMLDVSGNRIYNGTSFGAVEGGGTIHLGGSRITIGTLGLDSILSGPIIDGIGPDSQLTKVGGGKLSLDGTNTYTGLTTVEAGTLLVNGSIPGNVTVNTGATLGGIGSIGGNVAVAPGGILSPGTSPGTLTVGSLALNATSILNFEFGVVSDLMIVNGDLTLDGSLNISSGLGLTPLGQEIFTYSGTLTDNGLTIGSVPSGYSPEEFSLDFSIPGEIHLFGPTLSGGADFDQDGDVDGRDFLVWQRGGSPNPLSSSDLALWQAQYGSVLPLTSATSVPEPGASHIFVLAFAALIYCRKMVSSRQ